MAPSHSKESGYSPQEQLYSRGGPQKHYRFRTDWDLGLGESVEFPLPPFSDVSTSLIATDPSVSLATTGALVAPGSLIQRPVCQIHIYETPIHIRDCMPRGSADLSMCVTLCDLFKKPVLHTMILPASSLWLGVSFSMAWSLIDVKKI